MDLPDLITPHKFHTNTSFNSVFCILGGVNSAKCESFDGESWSPMPDLSEPHESPTCSTYHDYLYIMSKCIEKLENATWIKIMCIELVGCLGIVANEDAFLLLGGRTYSTYNSDILLARAATQDCIKLNEGSTGMYGLFGYIINGTTVYAVNNAGKLHKEVLEYLNN